MAQGKKGARKKASRKKTAKKKASGNAPPRKRGGRKAVRKKTVSVSKPPSRQSKSKSASDRVPPLRAAVLSEAFLVEDEAQREELGMPPGNAEATDIVVELNLFHEEGLAAAGEKLNRLYAQLASASAGKQPLLIANTYYRCWMSVEEAQELILKDKEGDKSQRAIYRIWPDFRMNLLINRSGATVKADAARRSYDATGKDIVWAVIDSGIDGSHPHFKCHDTLGGHVARLHKSFADDDDDPLVDEIGHGTHVGGILAGGLVKPGQSAADIDVCVGRRVAVSEESELEGIQKRDIGAERLAGVAPECRLISLKVTDAKGRVRSTDVIRALEYIRVNLNGHGKPPLRVHGVNLSLGYDFNARWFACGQSPVCIEVDRLVRTGVVVVAAAGNTGYGELQALEGATRTGLALTINDPGNANLAITVGATHRDSPHTYGVSYFSSKGPTGDGRLKPDLVAPGERIVSCASGRKRKELAGLGLAEEDTTTAAYIDDSGTSMAAPHVSGAIAAFLSIRREFIGRSEDVKRIFLDSATSLGRERYFEGHGLVDLMRAIQSV